MRQGKSFRKKTLLYAMISSALLLSTTGISFAADDDEPEFNFGQTVITVTKTPVKQAEANANITVINRQQIEENHYQDLTDALRNVPGVLINTIGNGAGNAYSNGISINGSKNVVVLIDGVRANVNGTPLTNFPGSLITSMDNIERIEVLKGSGSALYGSDAKGGVINIITRKADINQTTLTIAGGSYDRENYALANQGKSGDYSWFISSQKNISGNYTDGQGNQQAYHSNSTSNTFKLTKKINAASDITMSYDQYVDQFVYPYYGLNNGCDNNYKWKINYNYAFSNDSSNSLTLYTNRYKMNNYTTPWLMDTKTKGIQDQFTFKAGNDHRITTGFDIYQDKMVNYQDYYNPTNNLINGKTLTDRAIYVQDEWNLSKQWKLTSGLRNDNHSVYGNHLTPSINLGYAPDDQTNYYVAYKEFFISPDFYQLYDRTHGNANLKAETGHTVEAGVDHKFDDTLTATAHVFETSSKNKISTPSPSGSDPYENIDKDLIHGWDIQLNKKWSNSFSTFVGYTHTTESTVSEFASTPNGIWNIGMNYRQDKWDFNVQGNGYISSPKQQYLPCNTYWIWDTAVNYQVNKATKAFFKVNNLFNKYYSEYTDGAGPYGGYSYYTSPGRNYQFGIQYQF